MGANLYASRRQANIFICVLFYFELRGITKHLMTGPSGNSEFCFPSTSMFPSASPRGTLRVSGKQNSLFPLGPVIKCLMYSHVVHSVIQYYNATEELGNGTK